MNGRTRRPPARLGGALLAVAVLLAGCASIPDSGQVRTVVGDTDNQPSEVRYAPGGPSAGDTPAQIVYGFLDAMRAYPVTTDVAEEFMTDDAVEGWRSGAGATVYTAPRVAVGDTDSESVGVDLTVDVAAQLDARGRYLVRPQSQRKVSFELTRVGREWRIADPPAGVLITQEFFDAYYQPLSLFFLDTTAKQLVEDPVYVPSGDGLATSLVAGLLRGPEGLLGGQSKSFLPENARLVGSVPVRSSGLAAVKFGRSVRGLSVGTRERLSAQIVSTLAQVPGVTGVSIEFDGAPLDIPGVKPVQPVGSWPDFGPPHERSRGQVFALRENKLVVVAGDSTSKFAGPWGEDAEGAVDFRVDPRLRKIAVVPPGRSRVLVAGLSGSSATERRTVHAGTGILKPVWDANDRLWILDRAGNRSRLTIVDDKLEARAVPLGLLADKTLLSFELSPDNTRFVAAARDRAAGAGGTGSVYVGTVVKDAAGGVVTGVSEVTALPLARLGLRDARSAAWRSASTVAILASEQGKTAQSYLTRIDGSSVSGGALTGDPVLGDIGAVGVIGPGFVEPPLYVVDRESRLWLRNGSGGWQRVDADRLRAPSYPG